MQIKEIGQSREEILLSFALAKNNYPNLSAENYVAKILNLLQNGHKMLGVFADDLCVGAALFAASHKFRLGKIIEIDEFFVAEDERQTEISKILLNQIEQQAVSLNCQNIIANFETKQQNLQKIFAQQKFILDGFLFGKSC